MAQNHIVRLSSSLGMVETLPGNPRIITPDAMNRLKESIRRDPEFMRLRPIVIGPDGIVLGGNQRLRACAELGIDPLPDGWVVRAESLTEEQRRRFILIDNAPEGMSGTWDFGKLATGFADIDLGGIGFDMPRVFAGIPDAARPQGDASPRFDKAEELREKWGVEAGDLWELGNHRILCGDSTKQADVSRCLGGTTPFLMVTDPPYGVEYDPGWRERVIYSKNLAVGVVLNDDVADWSPAWRLFPGAVAYVWHSSLKTSVVEKSLFDAGFEIRSMIVWVKNKFPIGRGDYHWKHETCWYAVREGHPSRFADDRTQTTVWEIDKPMASETGHSTQKPVECMARAIRNHHSEYVYEPFSGSGTTIIACEQLGRKCLAIEISPKYVAIALQRWADATGKTPKKLP